MAMMPSEMLIKVAPNTDVVDLVCKNTYCRFNLMNACNGSNKQELGCNLKQIIIGSDGKCANFEIKE